MADRPFDPVQLHDDLQLVQKLLLIMAYDQQEGRPAEHGALLRAIAPEIWPEHFPPPAAGNKT
ncbi:MAG TPA: hypothetical protein VFF63_07775 [Candidatus Babeliales bacterium]|nr:hypothetical protein [Candidatus Babeliales bacterium]